LIRPLLVAAVVALLPHPGFAAMTRLDWANRLLGRLGAPQNLTNQHVLVAWMQAEGNGCQWNPLNTTQSEPGSTLCGSTKGIEAFPSCDLGLYAPSEVLHQIDPLGSVFDNSRILADLEAGIDGQATVNAILASGGGTGSLLQACYVDVTSGG